jgi:hypothetical protein
MLFPSPEYHTANPPETWIVVRVGRKYQLQTKDGACLQGYPRKRDAERDKTSGFYFDLYHKERRWYAGEPILGWRPYAEFKPSKCNWCHKPAEANRIYCAECQVKRDAIYHDKIRHDVAMETVWEADARDQ